MVLIYCQSFFICTIQKPTIHLVGGFKFQTWILFSMIDMGCHPPTIDEVIFFKMVIAPPTIHFFCWFTLPPLIIFNLPNEGWTNTVLEKNDRLRVSISWGDANIFDFRHCKTQLFLLSSYRYDRNCGIMSGWWFGTMEFYDFPFRWECHHPNWLSPHDFSEG